MSGNELHRAASPYLLQHADNPVHWRLWGPEALQEARRLRKPILLSVGYAACHWCHVMAHESFEDPDTAAVMNELFVNIKVDREERPDIDHLYMTALQALGQRGGWPLTMFLTPEGEAFWGGTYFPKSDQYGRPAFVSVLQRVAEAFHKEPATIVQNTKAIRERLQEAAASGSASRSFAFPPAQLIELATRIAQAMDPVDGGLKGAPKFPNTPVLEFLWRAGARGGPSVFRDLVALTLTKMSQGGIYDHLGGGFARYSTDARWLAPHFEKMLYDNALLLEMLALCHKQTGDDLFRRRVVETVEWLRREMTAPDGAFCASLDADSEGAEGRFYVWTFGEIVAALGEEDARFLGAFYDASPEGNWHDESRGETVIILNRLGSPAATPEEEARLAALCEKLRLTREGRPRPGLDDKIMADWNGLMIAALVKAALAFEEPDWIVMAARAYDFIVAKCAFHDEEGRLRLAHSWRAEALVSPGLALDHAAMMGAALALHEARNALTNPAPRRDYLADAKAWAEALESYHRDPQTGLLCMAARDARDLILRLSPTADDAIPNAHGVYLSALVRLAAQTGEDKWRERADALFAALTPAIEANFFGHLACLNALDSRLRAKTIVMIGPERQKLLAAALRLPYFDRIVVDADGSRPPSALEAAQWKAAKDKAGAAFVCAGETCSLPVWDEEGLRATLEAFDTATG
ncbi:thioredoxin domain-containing protein [Methylocystis bryophila]|uniref:Thioredoxin domain-containing protein n=1 Tax=Methylocystis bryophila TaxID=655015 RepID=A0A1W6MTQ8_9HYPH|nr:thioredoxin domain-containing protein [Methylocystis bryophila]ARN80991.1 thioredoxin domain-containing protein [Methylocystis bryophila]BDV36903.1 thioredoxin domain-containing protein [Methylocystis bryophila]